MEQRKSALEPVTFAAAYDQITLPVLRLSTLTLLLLFVLPLSAVLGYVSGKSTRRRHANAGLEVDIRAGETTVGAVLAILGLLMAFSFGNALTLVHAAKSALVDEAAALGTAFARADFLVEPGRSDLKQAIREYATTRIVPNNGAIDTLEKAQTFLEESLRAQSKLWPLTLENTADPVPAPIKVFFAGAINEVLDAHLFRMKTLSNPVAFPAQLIVLGAALTALFLMGNRSGLLGRALTWRTFVLSGFLIVIILLIADTYRVEGGLIQLDNSTLRAAIADMQSAMR